MGQTWSAAGYAVNGRFVAELAGDVLNLLDVRPGELILDLGCGDGFLTQLLKERGAVVTGVDSSPDMVNAARARGLDIQQLAGEQLHFQTEFDAVFSNAALHWMLDQPAVLRGVHRALRPGGRFVAEMGGHGNIAAIRAALSMACRSFGVDAEDAAANVYFTPEEYRMLLESHGFHVETIALIARPTPLPSGIRNWLPTFRRALLERLSVSQQGKVIDAVEAALRPILCDRSGHWIADYVRLRFHATSVAA